MKKESNPPPPEGIVKPPAPPAPPAKRKVGGVSLENYIFTSLLNCPFCGSPGKVKEIWIPEAVRENEIPAFNVGCQNIKCRGYALYGVFEANIPEEIKRWNKRI